jgi:hypothetical protein
VDFPVPGWPFIHSRPLEERCQALKTGWVRIQVQVEGWALEAETLRWVIVGKERVWRHAGRY